VNGDEGRRWLDREQARGGTGVTVMSSRRERRRLGRSRRLSAGARALHLVVVTSIVGSTFLIMTATAALACHDPGSPWNTVYKPGGTDWWGNRVSGPGMGVFDGNVDCGRVSSLFVTNGPITRWIEVGWYESPQGTYSCIPTTSGPPKILAFAVFDGMVDCKNPSANIGEGTDGFWVHDKDQDGVWKFFRNGNQVWTSFDMSPFNSGTLYNNGERLNFNNTAHADFDGLKKMLHQGNWADWNNTSLDTDLFDDSGSHGCKYSDTHTAVKLNETLC
jgi:hypothetical protein